MVGVNKGGREMNKDNLNKVNKRVMSYGKLVTRGKINIINKSGLESLTNLR